MKNQKVIDVYHGLVVKFKELISEHEIDHDDYQNLVNWMDQLGKSGEIPLFMDVFFETHALQEMYKNVKGTEPTILGPYYIEKAPEIQNPGVMPQRQDEPGDVLFFSGSVKDVDGNPLANTKIDMWQADANGEYSHFAEGIPNGNLRCVFYTDENGNFEVQTRVPGNYSIPADGPSGQFLKWINHHANRPAHLHLLLKPENGDKLVTQIYFEGDPYLENDVAQGVRGTLITKLEKQEDPNVMMEKGLNKPYYTAHLDFELRLQDTPHLIKQLDYNR
ncbi:dioxygenase family protein [Metabacillus arenae]|uniref:Catechol 1,2-dioxygenase n=1 Tax=Metabacillus arenae TaxID=2771434 RepID=A0A926RXB8_9BACI|nr:dioxygenase [Metabacillus arenae]MBD1381708.1 catechol 1,2-dioxygenase [Metabacillus arenae]